MNWTDGPGIAVPVLGGWHVYLASRGESSIESHDNHYLEGKAKAEGLVGIHLIAGRVNKLMF